MPCLAILRHCVSTVSQKVDVLNSITAELRWDLLFIESHHNHKLISDTHFFEAFKMGTMAGQLTAENLITSFHRTAGGLLFSCV